MLPTVEWPDVDEFTDHWEWLPDWTANRPRLLWYLTFEGIPDVRAAAAPPREVLAASGADVVPPDWLHLTVADVGFVDEIDDWAVRASQSEVRRVMRGVAPLQLTLGPLGVLPGAVVLRAGPAEPLLTIRTSVRRAMATMGIQPPDDMEENAGAYRPHVSLCYVNAHTDHELLETALRSAEPRTVPVRCDRLSQVVVTRSEGHYRWQVLAEVPLGPGPQRRSNEMVPPPFGASSNA